MPWLLFGAWLAVAATLVVGWHRIDRLRIPVLVVVLVLSTIHQLMFATLAEDAFISLRYSANLAEGNGLVFNVGERVEGYSNLLWVVLVAAPHALFDTDIVTTARVLGVLCTLGCVLIGYLLASRLTGKVGAGLLAATVIAAASSLAAYGPSGLETPLFTLLMLLVLLAVQAGWAFGAGLLVALATMTRPDGVIVAVVVGVWLIARAIRRGGWRAPLMYALGAVLLAAPWTVWRVAYYGHLMPNAIAAKSGASTSWLLATGADYLAGFAIAAQALVVLLPVAVFALVKKRSLGMPALILTLAVVYICFFVATGGDWMPGWRFFAPAMPLIAVGSIAAGAGAWHITSRAAPALAASVAGLLLVSSVWQPNFKHTIDVWHAQVNDLADTGTWLREMLPSGTVVATYANGALSYEAGTDITVVDLLGLTDEHIAREGERDLTKMIGHQAQDYPYVINDRRPSVVLLSGTGFSKVKSTSCHLREPFGDEYRALMYRVVGHRLWATVLVRTDEYDEIVPMLDRSRSFTREVCPD